MFSYLLIKFQSVYSLISFFSDQADDSEKKCKDLEKSVCDYQSLLKEASHRYGALEDQCERDRAGMLQLQWGSELVWYSNGRKVELMPNGPVFEYRTIGCHLVFLCTGPVFALFI